MLQSKISRLPAYLTIQFVRFFYKEKGSINAKVLRDVKFPMEFDAFDLCTSELQEKLAPARGKFKVSTKFDLLIMPVHITHRFYLLIIVLKQFQELEDALVETSAKEKTKGDNSKVQKKDKKYAPYWFENGK